MRIPPERLVDGCIRTLQEDVLPSVPSRFARGQLYAVLDVLRNLRDRVEEKRALAEAEGSSAEGALRRAVDALRAAGAKDEASALEERIAAIPPEDPERRCERLNEAFVVTLEALAALPETKASAAHAALGGHLAAQALRDLATLKPSLLEEISRG